MTGDVVFMECVKIGSKREFGIICALTKKKAIFYCISELGYESIYRVAISFKFNSKTSANASASKNDTACH
jgi:hypothetical protein